MWLNNNKFLSISSTIFFKWYVGSISISFNIEILRRFFAIRGGQEEEEEGVLAIYILSPLTHFSRRHCDLNIHCVCRRASHKEPRDHLFSLFSFFPSCYSSTSIGPLYLDPLRSAYATVKNFHRFVDRTKNI